MIATSGKIAPAVNASADVHAAWNGRAARDLGDAELVADVRAQLVVRHQLFGDEPREPGLDAAVLVDLRELAQLAARVRSQCLGFDRGGRPLRRRAAS